MSKAPGKRKFVLSATRFPKKACIDFEGELNAEQFAAVMAPEAPALVVAGAGTGKTRVITYRVARFLQEGARPSEVMLLTFTNKAAREMMSRVESLVGSSVHELWGGTFHHIANRTLAKNAERLGYRPGYGILDREDSRSLMRACVADAGPKRGSDKRFPQAQVIEAIHSACMNTMTTAAEVIEERYQHLADRTEDILKVLRAYVERKRQSNAMDYDDLLWNWRRLLDEDGVRDALRSRFCHVLVDEYQDTNRLQGEIIDALCLPDRSVTVVGDDSQSIYGWRGATDVNMLGFPERYPGGSVYRLETNYRSTPQILEVANRSLVFNPRRFEKTLRPSREDGLLPEVVPCRDAFQQSRFVAERIVRMHEDGVALENMAVLYRSHWNALELQVELQRRDVPFRIRGGIRFFEQAHIKDVTAFLRVATNPRDEIAWLRLFPLVPHVGPATTRAVADALAESGDPLAELGGEAVLEIVGKRGRQGFGRLARVVEKISRPAMLRAPAEMMRVAADDFYGEYLASRYPNARLRMEDLAQLGLFAAQFKSAREFLSDLALSGVVEAETTPVGPDEDRYVTLSTVHQAKGLEWPVVFVIWLADGRFPTDFAGKVEGGYEEERRLFHVAVTRAKDELVMAYPMTYHWRGMDPVLMKRSRFLAELDEAGPEPCYEIVEIEEQGAEEIELPPPCAISPEPAPAIIAPVRKEKSKKKTRAKEKKR